MTMLRIRNLGVRFGGVVALKDVSLDLNRGEILGLIGPNGAGKTTLFNCISGVIAPNEGTIHFEGRSLRFAPPHERARRNTISDALGLPFSHYGERAASERARAIIHALDLGRHAHQLAADLPAGIQRRVELGRALAMRPKLVLLDEPAAGLDARETEHLAKLLHRVRERFRVSMLLVDHDMSLVMRVCDYIYVLDFGKVLSRGEPSAVRNDQKVIAAYLGEATPETASDGEEAVVVAAEPRLPRKDALDVARSTGPLLEVTGMAAGYEHLEVIRDINLTVQ